MRRLRERIALAVSASVLVVGYGCGDGRPSVSSSTQEGTVKGTVTIKGKLATKGQVVLDPANYKRKDAKARSGPIGADGTYSVTTLVGENSVRVEGPEVEQAGALYSSLSIDVKAGENPPLDIKLPPD